MTEQRASLRGKTRARPKSECCGAQIVKRIRGRRAMWVCARCDRFCDGTMERAGFGVVPLPEHRGNVESVADALREAVAAYPDQRVCQIIVNATNRNDPFYVEDSELDRMLRDYAAKAGRDR